MYKDRSISSTNKCHEAAAHITVQSEHGIALYKYCSQLLSLYMYIGHVLIGKMRLLKIQDDNVKRKDSNIYNYLPHVKYAELVYIYYKYCDCVLHFSSFNI